jgi:large subunit ribosomal protein L24
MPKLHVVKGDEVVVISGSHKGKRGNVIAVLVRDGRAVVEGVSMVKKHMRKSQQYPQGAIVEREGTVHVSNLMKVERYEPRKERRKRSVAGS